MRPGANDHRLTNSSPPSRIVIQNDGYSRGIDEEALQSRLRKAAGAAGVPLVDFVRPGPPEPRISPGATRCSAIRTVTIVTPGGRFVIVQLETTALGRVTVRCEDQRRVEVPYLDGIPSPGGPTFLHPPVAPSQCVGGPMVTVICRHIVEPQVPYAEVLKLSLDDRARVLNAILTGRAEA